MRTRHGRLFTAVCLCFGAFLPTLAAEPAPKPPNAQGAQDIPEAPLTIDQVIALLEAKVGEKVILRQIEATGTRLTMTVETLLSLKAAGASDALLEALQGNEVKTLPVQKLPEMVARPAAGEGEYPFRVFLMEDSKGERVVHITNLDENGKRIGGELSPDDRASRNVVTPVEQGGSHTPSYDAPPSDAGNYGDHENRQPVVVNVYNTAPASPSDGTALIGGSEPIGGDAFIYPGIYPGYFNYGYGYSPNVYPPHGAQVGPRWGHGGVIYSPPGSYSHYVRYHRPYGSHHFKQATPYYYNYGVPASVRNRHYFRTR